MDVSGGSGRPRPGNDESAEPRAEPTAPASGSARPEPADTGPPGGRPADRPGPADEHHGQPAPTAPEPTGARPPTDDSGTRALEPEAPGTPDTEPPGSGPQGPRTPAPGAGASATPGPGKPGHGKPEPETPETKTPETVTPGTVTPETRAQGPRVPGATRPDPHTDGGAGPGKPPQRKPEPGGGLLMGRPFGVPVYVAPSWFLVAALITWVFGGQLDRVLPELGAARYLVSLFFAVAFYASVLVHELAHTVAALRFKLPVRRIQLQFFGGVSEIEKEAETPGREFVLAFVGPLLSLVLAGVFYAALLPVEPDSVPGVLLAGLMISNLLVAAFNLLPGLPLDGGRMLRAVVWKITGKPMSGTIAAAWIGRALAIAVLIGLPLLTQSLGSDAADDVGMDTVMDALLAAILAAIIWTGAGNSLRMARLREHLPELRARALTRRAVPVPADTPLSEALRRANASGARALVVVDADGAPVSLVREAAIVGVPEHRRPWVPVSTLAQDLTDGMRVSAELSGEELLDALRANPATEYLVVEETGEIYGVLSAADVERAFVKAMARPS
nr:site-2 protease family protein [Streptomyces sp. Alain-F2R5]